MEKRKIIILGIAILLIVAVFFIFKKSRLPGPQTIQITVDVSKSLGEMSSVLKSNIWYVGWTDVPETDDYMVGKFFRENNPAVIQFNDETALRYSSSFEDYTQRLKGHFALGSPLRSAVDEIVKSDAELVFSLDPRTMPSWLSSYEGDLRDTDRGQAETVRVEEISPPKCYGYKCTSLAEVTCHTNKCIETTKKQLEQNGYVTGWQPVVDYALKYLINDLRVRPERLSYFVGHEQERDWIGNEASLFEYYKYSAIAAKNVNTKIKVGGIGSASWSAPKLGCDWEWWADFVKEWCKNEQWPNANNQPINENLIEYVAGYNKMNPQAPLPLDFVNWHSFAVNPNQFEEIAKEVKSWLSDNGFSPEKIHLHSADWTYWAKAYPAGYLDTERPASYIIPTLYHMSKAGIDWHGHDFNVGAGYIGDSPISTGEFIGDWPIYTRDGIIKPSYNSFKALSILNGRQDGQTPNRIEANFNEEDFITAIASQTKDKSKTRILLSNFIPQDEVLLSYLFDKFQESPSWQSAKAYQDEIKTCIGSNSKDSAKIQQCSDSVLNKITNPVLKERFQTQVKLQVCIITTKSLQCFVDAQQKTADELTKQDIEILKKEYETIIKYQTTPREISVNLKNLPFSGEATLTTYSIDKDHSNSCRYNERTEEASTDTECGINGAVDKQVKQAKEEAREKTMQALNESLKEKGYSDNDISRLRQLVETSASDINKIKSAVQQYYNGLDRCKNSACAFDTIWAELTAAFVGFKEANDALFYNGKFTTNGKTLTTSVWIDKINNNPNISLEGSKQESKITVTDSAYKASITMHPYSVLLLEISR